MSGSLASLRLCAAVVALAICLRPQPSAAAPAASDAVDPVAAQVEPVGRSADPLPGLEAFVDGVTANLAQQHIAGVQLAIVKDGQARLIKGYGLGALEPERPVNPERTLFHLASISKTFTWLAIMQLVDRGKLRLEDPVNDHLPADLAIPSDGWDEPVRVIDLMNHTAGFEDVFQGPKADDDSQLVSLQDTLRDFRPTRVRAPGTLSVYSNYGAALAGAIVAHESGVDFETYVDRQILEPLHMTHTTFREPYGTKAPRGLPAPMPKALETDRGSGIEWERGAWKAFPQGHILWDAPAGAGSSTAADMARYMLALLDPAELERAGVLRRTAYATMTSESFRPARGLRAIHHGFFDAPPGSRDRFGYANLSHSGFIDHFPCNMWLFPELRLGVFVASNSNAGHAIVGTLHALILRRYFPPQPRTPVAKAIGGDVREYAGRYRPLRRPYTKLEAVFSIGVATELEATKDGALVLGNRDDSARFERIGPDLFQRVGGDSRIAFVRDDGGHIVRAVGTITGERLRFWETVGWLRLWLIAGLVAVCGVLVQAGLRRRARRVRPTATPSRADRAAAWLTRTAAVWAAYYVAASVWQFRYGFGNVWDNYPQPILKVTLALGIAAIVATVPALATAPLTWRASEWSVARRVWHTLALALLVMAALTLHQWNAIGFNYYGA